MHKITEATGISIERIYFILYNELNTIKLSARWISRLLRAKASSYANIDCLEMFKKNPCEFHAVFRDYR